jgi:hypothetical protein
MRNQSWLVSVFMWTSTTLGILACACGGNKETTAPSAPEVPTNPTPAAEPVKPVAIEAVPKTAAPSSIEDPAFTLQLAEAGPYKAGELARFVVKLEPHGHFHVNQEYPIEIALKGDADTNFPKASLTRADAAQFDEKSARFDVPFTAQAAGDHKLLANIKFAVCTAENCVPDERDLALAVAVK